MRTLRVVLILAACGAVPVAGLTGCKVDRASRESSTMAQQQQITPQHGLDMPSPPDTTPARESHDRRPLVVCFGDSLTAGYGADDGQSYPDYLQKDLDRDGFKVHVVNEGISGNTTKDGLDRLDDVTARKPQVVVLEFGGNDGLRGLKVDTTRQNLAAMIEGLKSSGASVVVAGITLPPDYGTDYVTRFTGNYAALGRQYNVPVLPFLLRDVYGVKGMMQADNIHATNRGNEIVAKNVLPYVEKALRAR